MRGDVEIENLIDPKDIDRSEENQKSEVMSTKAERSEWLDC
jgi:hypothetical protein